MRTPREIYAQYKIMPSLQLHQLRVAAVAKLVCDGFTKPINTNDVVLACLFHDMGNIVKSNFSAFPDFCEPEGVAYWERIKDEFMKKYGADSHTANVVIAREIGLPDNVTALIDGIGYSKMQTILESLSFELKICEYADTRVAPRGVLSQQERILEGKQRYDDRKMEKPKPHYMDSGFGILLNAARELEHQVFSDATITPENITNAAVAPLIEELWEYPVS